MHRTLGEIESLQKITNFKTAKDCALLCYAYTCMGRSVLVVTIFYGIHIFHMLQAARMSYDLFCCLCWNFVEAIKALRGERSVL